MKTRHRTPTFPMHRLSKRRGRNAQNIPCICRGQAPATTGASTDTLGNHFRGRARFKHEDINLGFATVGVPPRWRCRSDNRLQLSCTTQWWTRRHPSTRNLATSPMRPYITQPTYAASPEISARSVNSTRVVRLKRANWSSPTLGRAGSRLEGASWNAGRVNTQHYESILSKAAYASGPRLKPNF